MLCVLFFLLGCCATGTMSSKRPSWPWLLALVVTRSTEALLFKHGDSQRCLLYARSFARSLLDGPDAHYTFPPLAVGRQCFCRVAHVTMISAPPRQNCLSGVASAASARQLHLGGSVDAIAFLRYGSVAVTGPPRQRRINRAAAEVPPRQRRLSSAATAAQPP